MTFEADSAAVHAFQFSFPVICLDACFTTCGSSSSVLLTATFKATNGRLLTMAAGTASKETAYSWCLFLVNLRQVLIKCCSLANLDWNAVVFMSDRHSGLLSGISTHFPECKHLYCVIHLLRNLRGLLMEESSFWKAVQATTKQEFDCC